MSRDITMCHPRLQKLAAELVKECAKAGLMVKITDCYRDAAEQAECVSNGTSSLYYPNSQHNWGTAFDFCRADGKGKGYYNGDRFFERVGAIGRGLGLEWGGDWIKPLDRPHFQLPDWGTSTAGLKALYGTPERFRETWKEEQEEDEVKEVRYNTIDEVPEWGRATIQSLIDKGCFAEPKNMNLSEDMVRVFVVIGRSK